MKKFKYIELKEQMLKMLKGGLLIKDDKVLSEREISTLLGYSRSTVRRAVDSLIEDKVLFRKKSYNSSLYFHKTNPFILEVGDKSTNSISQDIKINDMLLEDKIISFRLLYDYEQSKFNQKRVYELIRLRKTSQGLLSLQKAYIPFDYFEDAHRYDFSNISLYDYMENKGQKPVYFMKKLRFIKPTKELNNYFHLKEEERLYYFEYFGYTKNDVLVEYTKSFFKQDTITINFKYKQ